MVVLTEIKDDPPPAPETAEEKPSSVPSSINIKSTGDNIKIFRRPYAHHLFNNKVDLFCSECFKAPEVQGKLFNCTACNFVNYCSKECQKMGWKLHKAECQRLQKVFPNLPLSEVLFLSKVLDRKNDIEQNGDKLGYEAARPLMR